MEKVTEGEEVQERIVQGWAERLVKLCNCRKVDNSCNIFSHCFHHCVVKIFTYVVMERVTWCLHLERKTHFISYFRQKRRQKYSAISYNHRPGRTDTPSSTPEKDDKDKSQDMASATSPKNGQQKATEELQNKDDVSAHCTSDVHEVDENSEVPEKENKTSPASGRSGESTGELSVADSSSEQKGTLRQENGGEFSSEEMLNKEKESKTGNGLIPFGNDGLPSEMSESSNLLASNPKPSASKTLWRNVRDSFTKSSDHLPQVPSEILVPVADVNVAVVSYKRSTSRDYSKIDVHDDDEDHSALYSDISTSWPTSFWTQFTVLLLRTFKQSKPDILSKLELSQVSTILGIV